ncbi:MAG: 4-hydroxy-3-methylbut-2-enyl diphosphate reductase [Pseudomonadota bacterium]
MTKRSKLDILLCAPRGFCAGVDRAIQIVELALERYGAPVYVRHQIVHNRFVVDSLRAKGAVFVKELDEIPDTDAPVIFSAHGVPKAVPEAAATRNLFHLDATCPLVSKVHKEAQLHYKRGRHIVLIGHAGHPEVIGTMGQLPPGAVTLLETEDDARSFMPDDQTALAYITQTTLSVDDTRVMIGILQERFPDISGPHKEDICYATTNRQEAVKAAAPRADATIVVGAPNSSNSNRLVDVAKRADCPVAVLVERADDLDFDRLGPVRTIAITAGASAPEALVEEVIAAFAARYEITIDTVRTADEDVIFNLPRVLREAAE